ncbi:NAD-binding protein [Desulfococcus sp.]|uniref:NAD-binding protein n=1 Tax=Desulfococcus sp. TaxID=2025834 RepID=UPI0035937254
MASDISDSPLLQTRSDQFLVCGLGSLGQHCVANLKKFGVGVSAIDLLSYGIWEIESVPEILDRLLVGDCRHPTVLNEIEVWKYRAILFVTSDDRINIEAAFEARLRNPSARLVVRSGKTNLNTLLQSELGNFTALEPGELSASAFALAAFGDEMPASFQLEDRLARVIAHRATPGDALVNTKLGKLNSGWRRVLTHYRGDHAPEHLFFEWNPEDDIRDGDIAVWIEALSPKRQSNGSSSPLPLSQFLKGFRHTARLLRRTFRQWLHHLRPPFRDQLQRLVLLCGGALLGFLMVGGVLFYMFGPQMNLTDAFFAAACLLIGGYPDLLGGEFQFQLSMPWWLRLFGLTLAVVGTLFVGALYALMTQSLITARLRFFKRPAVSRHGHVVVIGLEMFGKRVVGRLQGLCEKVVGIEIHEASPDSIETIALLTLNKNHIAETLQQANVHTAKSVMTVTNDEMENLEITLMALRMNPAARFVVRTYNPRFSDNLARLFPNAQVLCVSALAAEAFVAAAFGERVPQLFRLKDHTIIVTEYKIESGDSLDGLLLSEVAYGFRVVPFLHINRVHGTQDWMPSDDNRLAPGDRLFVLATMNGLRRIELGRILERRYIVHVVKQRHTLMTQANFEGANVIARISGCDLGTAQALMANLPGDLPHPVYYQQGLTIVEKLHRNMIEARLVKIAS